MMPYWLRIPLSYTISQNLLVDPGPSRKPPLRLASLFVEINFSKTSLATSWDGHNKFLVFNPTTTVDGKSLNRKD